MLFNNKRSQAVVVFPFARPSIRTCAGFVVVDLNTHRGRQITSYTWDGPDAVYINVYDINTTMGMETHLNICMQFFFIVFTSVVLSCILFFIIFVV